MGLDTIPGYILFSSRTRGQMFRGKKLYLDLYCSPAGLGARCSEIRNYTWKYILFSGRTGSQFFGRGKGGGWTLP